MPYEIVDFKNVSPEEVKVLYRFLCRRGGWPSYKLSGKDGLVVRDSTTKEFLGSLVYRVGKDSAYDLHVDFEPSHSYRQETGLSVFAAMLREYKARAARDPRLSTIVTYGTTANLIPRLILPSERKRERKWENLFQALERAGHITRRKGLFKTVVSVTQKPVEPRRLPPRA
jgi:hypothetical protein